MLSWQRLGKEMGVLEGCVEQCGVAMISHIDVGHVNMIPHVPFVSLASKMGTMLLMTSP